MTKQEALNILGLPNDADRTQIRHAYSEKSKIYHVETHPEEFHRLHEAYKTVLQNASQSFNTDSQIQHTASDTKKNVHFSFDYEQALQDLTKPEAITLSTSTYDKLLDQLIAQDSPVQSQQELIQLIYYKCRHDESADMGSEKKYIMNREMEYSDDLFLNNADLRYDGLADTHSFFDTTWKDWKTLTWTPIICHPEFLKTQYDLSFLTELCQLLQKETTNNTNGISQNLYYSLCLAYGFFDSENPTTPVKNTALEAIENILLMHPRHQDYIKNLENRGNLKSDHKLTLLCQKAFAFSISNHTSVEEQEFTSDFFSTIYEMLIFAPTPEKEFVFNHLTSLPHTLFSEKLPEYLMEITQIKELQKECYHDFYETLLQRSNEENNLYESCYQPLCYRMQAFKDKYLTNTNWKKIICSPFFVQSLKNWLFQHYGSYVSSIPSYMEYDTWKELITWFSGDSPLEQSTTTWLQTSCYFPEYLKRYRHELIWREQHIEEAYFKEVLPIPELNQGKHDLLKTVKQGTPVYAKDITQIMVDASCPNEYAFVFLTRLTNALTHFKFLITTQKSVQNAVPGDAFCFMKEQVILYYKKENLTCYLTHQTFYDILSRRFDFCAERAQDNKLWFTDDFIDTACKNLYYYRCYIESSQSSSNSSSDSNIS